MKLRDVMRFWRESRGVSAVEAAFVFPVLLIVFFIVVEIAHAAVTIEFAENAVDASVTRFREAGELGPTAENDIRQGVAAFSHGMLTARNVTRVTVTEYASLEAMGNPAAGAGNDEEDEAEEAGESRYPAWNIVVVISKDFITPIPRLLLTKRHDFTYRFERVVSYLPLPEDGEDA